MGRWVRWMALATLVLVVVAAAAVWVRIGLMVRREIVRPPAVAGAE